MKQKFLRLTLMGIAMMFMGMSAQAQTGTITITSENLDGTSSYPTTDQTFTVDGVDFGYNTGVYRPTANNTPSGWAGGQVIQFKKNSGKLYNTSAIANIVKVKIWRASGTAHFTLYSGNSAKTEDNGIVDNAKTGVTSGTETVKYSTYSKSGKTVTITDNQDIDLTYFEFDLSSSKPSYFNIAVGNGTLYLYKIEITYAVPMTITAAEWASFSSTSEVAIPEGVKAYYASSSDGSNVTLKEITTGIIPANEGVVINGTANTYYANSSATSAANITGNLLKPWTTAGTPSEATYYTLAAGPTFKQSIGGTLAAGKAYLVIPDGARELTISFDETTAIQNIERATVNDNRYYTLDGREVKNPTKGIYIINGKKVVIR